MNWINKILKGDRVIWVVMFLLGIISLIAVYSATSSQAHVRTGAYNEKVLLKHAATILAGYLMMFITSRINYRRFSRAIELVLLLCSILLVFTLIFGDRENLASRTLMGFQPSEFAKIVLITYLAKYIVVWNQKEYTFRDLVLPIFLPILIIVVPIFPENLSTAAMLFMVCVIMLFIGQIKFKYIMALLGIALLGGALYILTDDIMATRAMKRQEKIERLAEENPNDKRLKELAAKKPRQSRVTTWKRRLQDVFGGNTEEQALETNGKKAPKKTEGREAQKTYAKIAVARGGLFGKGSGKSTQRNFLPKPFNDCIYAIIVEEYGLLGGIFVMLLYIILLTRAFRIVRKRPLSFGALMSFGIAFILITQAMINMGVSTGLLPVTGQQLPFISKGGSSMLVTGIAVGMILSVTRSLEETEHGELKAENEDTGREDEEQETNQQLNETINDKQ